MEILKSFYFTDDEIQTAPLKRPIVGKPISHIYSESLDEIVYYKRFGCKASVVLPDLIIIFLDCIA